MAAQGGRPLPKFGEWDVNNPSSADGFTVIFAKARDDKKTTGTAASGHTPPQHHNNINPREDLRNPSAPPKKKRFCCFP